jgi:hypothetical protein
MCRYSAKEGIFHTSWEWSELMAPSLDGLKASFYPCSFFLRTYTYYMSDCFANTILRLIDLKVLHGLLFFPLKLVGYRTVTLPV